MVRLVSRIIAEDKRLQASEKEAEESLLEAHRRAAEALARLTRLRAQRQSLVSRGAKFVNLGLESLDELDRFEAAESSAVVDAQSFGAFGVVDWSSVGLDSGLSDLLGSVDGTSQVPLNNGSGS
jgi:hypothetical protein